MSHTDEFKALLTLMREVENSGMTNAVLKLLNGWEKRIPEKDQRQVFSSIPKRDWCVESRAFSCWILEQKIRHPNDIKCDIQEIGTCWGWADETDVPGSLQRMGYIVTNCNDEEYIQDLIHTIEHDFFNKIAKTPTHILLFEKFLDQLEQSHPKHKSSCVLDATDALYKKIKFPFADKKQYDLHRSLMKTLHYNQNGKGIVDKILPVLEQLNGNQLPYGLERKLNGLFPALPFNEFARIRTVLQSKGWSEAQINTWARPLTSESLSESNGWIAHWAEHSRTSLLTHLAPIITDCFEVYLSPTHFKDYLDELTPLINEVHAAGITAKEINSHLVKHPKHFQERLCLVFEQYSGEMETKWQKLCAAKSFTSTLKRAEQILPPAVVGSMISILHANGHIQTPPTQLLPFKAASTNFWRELCYGEKQVKKVLELQQQYLALQERCKIQKSLPKSKSCPAPLKRKM